MLWLPDMGAFGGLAVGSAAMGVENLLGYGD